MTSSTELQQQIVAIERELAPLSAELDRHISDFVSDLPPQVKSWMEREVKRHIEKNPEKIMSRGADFARAVKSDLEQLYGQLPKICENAVGPSNSWPHNKSADAEVPVRQRSNESFFAASFRKAINHLGSILHKHELLETSDANAGSWKQLYGAGFQYAYNPGFSDRDNPAAVKYNAAKAKHDQLANNLLSKRRELERAKVGELWDQA
jgi:hypothetical protein